MIKINLKKSSRRYKSEPGEEVEKTEEFFVGRKIKYEAIYDSEDIKIKTIYVKPDELSLNAKIEDIEEYLIDREEELYQEEEAEIVTEEE